MEMLLKMLTLMFLTGKVTPASVRQPDHTEVVLGHQQNTSLQVSYGSTLTLYCCLNVTKRDPFFITWYFNMSIKINNSSKTLGKDLNECPDKERAYNLTNVSESDSGWYSCKLTVDIPTLREENSNQIQIIVSENLRESTTYPSIVTTQPAPLDPGWRVHWWIWIIVGVSSVTLLTLPVIFLLKRRKCARKRAVEPVYANTPNRKSSPQARMPADSLKAPSTYQNFRTPRSGRKANMDKTRYQ